MSYIIVVATLLKCTFINIFFSIYLSVSFLYSVPYSCYVIYVAVFLLRMYKFCYLFSVVCDGLESVDSGTFNMFTNGIATYADYSCDAGYYLSGETQRQCDSDGVWSGSKPACSMYSIIYTF